MILSVKHMTVLCIATVLLGGIISWGLGTVVLMGETSEEPVIEGGVMVEASHFPLKLTMMINKTTFKIEEAVNITLFLENIGNETLTLVLSSGTDRFGIAIYDMNGSQVYKTSYLYPAVYIPIDVPPRLALSTIETWFQKTDAERNGQQVETGKYRIVGLFITRTLNFTIETPPVTITVAS